MQVRQLSQNLFLKCSLPGTKWGGDDPLLNGAPQQAEQHSGAGPNPTPTTSMLVFISVKVSALCRHGGSGGQTCKGIAGLLQCRAGVVSANCALFSDITNWWLQQQQLELPKEYLHSSGLRRTRVVETHLFFTIVYLRVHARYHSHLSERLGRVDGLLSPAAMACGSWHAAWLGCFGARLCGRVAQPRVQASPATALGVYQRAMSSLLSLSRAPYSRAQMPTCPRI
eukprot:scaffold14055_cov70-Phaeocystis_antarctica.AAC.1